MMYTFRAAIVDDQQWAKVGSLLIATSLGCFLVYAGMFSVAYLFSTATGLTWRAFAGRRGRGSRDVPAPTQESTR